MVHMMFTIPLYPAWYKEALCRGVNADLFYPERGEPTGPAKAVCAQCPVKDECLETALRDGERFGVWGGKSERERRRIRRERRLKRLEEKAEAEAEAAALAAEEEEDLDDSLDSIVFDLDVDLDEFGLDDEFDDELSEGLDAF